MNLPVVLTDQAEQDFDAAGDWYEEKARMGERFTVQVRKAFDRIGRMPESLAVVHRDVRRVRVEGFPYLVFYRAQVDRVEVIAIVHNRRDPSTWKSRA